MSSAKCWNSLIPYMAKRLQITLQDRDYEEIRRMAHMRHISISEWGRQPMDLAPRREPRGSVSKKLEAIRVAAKQEFPVSDIDQMLAEI
jgi:hypothetical protein